MQQHNNTDLATQARHLRDNKAAFKSVHWQEVQLLTRFLPYIYNVKKDFEGKGRAAFNDVALVCWDGMSLPTFNHFRSILFPDLQMSAERHAMGFDLRTGAGSQEYHHWLRKRPRQILENLLGPLVLPATSAAAQAAMAQFAYAHPQAARDAFQQDAKETCPPSTRLFDFSGSGYTVFQRIALDQSALLRVRVAPPLFRDTHPQWDSVPPVLQLLHFIWQLLATRCHPATQQAWLTSLVDLSPVASRQNLYAALASPQLLAPETVGLNYGVTGHLVINWTRFMRSPLYSLFLTQADCSPSAAATLHTFTPDRMPQLLLAASKDYRLPNLFLDDTATKKPRLVQEIAFSGVAPVPGHTQALLDAEAKAKASHASRVLYGVQQDLGTLPALFDEVVTVIDPYALQFKEYVFDGPWHARRRAKKALDTTQQKLNAAKVTAPTPAAHLGLTARVYSFQFRPREYLSPSDLEYAWFPLDHVETVYAIRQQKQLYFIRPKLLNEARRACPPEIEAWTRALDFLRVVERFYEDGSFANLAEVVSVSKSNFFQNARKEFLERVARESIPAFMSLDNASYSQLQKIKLRAGQVYLRENPDATDSKRWYYEYILRQARPNTNITQVRRIARVLLPGAETTEPVNVHFYSRSSIKTFLKIATRAVMGEGTVPGVSSGPVGDEVLGTLTQGLGAAPYITAWAKFCLDMDIRGVEFSEEAYKSKIHWNPLEDFILFQNYCKYPRLTAAAWTDLLAQLPNRNRQACSVRIAAVNTTLRKILTPNRFAHYRVGSMRGDPFRAKRAIFMLALADRVTGPKDYLLTQIVQKLTPDRLERIKLPGTYRGNFFTTFAF